MKAKVKRGNGFLGALKYTHAKNKDAEKVGGNMTGGTVAELNREFGITRALRPDCINPVWHCSLALPKGERLSAEQWHDLTRDFLIEMGLDPSNFLYTAVRHNDTNFDHVHIVASRIGLDGQLWHGQRDVFTAIEATQKLEQKYGLTLTPGLDAKPERASLNHNELNAAIRSGIKAPRTACQEAIDAVLNDGGAMPAPEFIQRLEAFGVRAVPSVASTGTMNGFSFETEGVSFTGSKLGESYKWAKLQTRGVEYVKDRDFESLADTKRRAAGVEPNGAAVEQPRDVAGGDAVAVEQPERVSGQDPGAPGAASVSTATPEKRKVRPTEPAKTGQQRPSGGDSSKGMGSETIDIREIKRRLKSAPRSLLDRVKDSLVAFWEILKTRAMGETVEPAEAHGTYAGTITDVDSMHAFQETAAGHYTAHRLDRLDVAPEVNAHTAIEYDGQGWGTVSDGESIERPRMR